jgi:serine/threonine-protein phosphatase 2B catalytic subunit
MVCRRRSDIENERLPPDLVDPESAEAKQRMSNTTTPHEDAGTGPAPGLLADRLAEVAQGVSPASSVSPITPGSPLTPTSPSLPAPGPGGRGHRRQASLGTTKTSPSNRRRSIEGTMALIKDAVDGEDKGENQWQQLANDIAGHGPSQ